MTRLSPAERGALGNAALKRNRDNRRARYDALIASGVSRTAAAEKVGISPSTAYRYDTQLRQART